MIRTTAVLALLAAIVPALAQQPTGDYQCPDTKCKAKEATLCVANTDIRTDNTPAGAIDLDSGNGFIYDCTETYTGDLQPIGFFGYFCSEPEGSTFNTALCHAQITMRECNQKTPGDWSSLALSYWQNDDDLDGLALTNTQSPVVTGANGAWGKPENIMNFRVAPYTGTNGYDAYIYVTYKTRGWNPSCAGKTNKKAL